MAFLITRTDPRFPSTCRGHNLRWPAHEADAADRIFLCEDPADAATTLQQVVSAGLRPTVRSGGHCYEDFVANNPHGAILDVSALSRVTRDRNGAFHIGPGAQLWNVYDTLYKQHGVTLPGGACGTVGAGGHISAGGYGALSRLMGLSSDWLTAVSILTVNKHGDVLPIRATAQEHPDLLRACKGAGAASYGLVTDFEFAKLPTAPRQNGEADLNFSWNGMTVEKFTTILQTFGRFCETHGQEPQTWGLYAVLEATHQSSGSLSLGAQFCNPDGACSDLRPQQSFMDLFANLADNTGKPNTPIKVSDWLQVTARHAGSPNLRRAKFKSTYMKKNFTGAECAAIYRHLTRNVAGTSLKEATLEIHLYGGAINKQELADTTAVQQRGSVMKLQFITYWDDASQDAQQTQWMNDFYQDLYSGPDASPGHTGTPFWNQHYEGCYINYPDADMLRYSFWPQLYYGEHNYPRLQQTKQSYDPNNVFHNAMSVRL